MGHTAISREGGLRTHDLRFPKPADWPAFLPLETEHPAGIEPALPAWRAGRLPLHHGCTVGPEGLEPSPRWLRARDAAANTWIPSSIGPEGVEPSSGPYKEPALAVELRAKLSVGPEGVEPPPYRLKGGYAAITPRPRKSSRTYRFQRVAPNHGSLPRFISPGRNRTSHRRRIRSPCSCYTTGPSNSP